MTLPPVGCSSRFPLRCSDSDWDYWLAYPESRRNVRKSKHSETGFSEEMNVAVSAAAINTPSAAREAARRILVREQAEMVVAVTRTHCLAHGKEEDMRVWRQAYDRLASASPDSHAA